MVVFAEGSPHLRGYGDGVMREVVENLGLVEVVETVVMSLIV
jgi:hypothetical protein